MKNKIMPALKAAWDIAAYPVTFFNDTFDVSPMATPDRSIYRPDLPTQAKAGAAGAASVLSLTCLVGGAPIAGAVLYAATCVVMATQTPCFVHKDYKPKQP